MNLRELGQQLVAWRGFREVTHAARTIAATQVLRWQHHDAAARSHLDRMLAVPLPKPVADEAAVVIGIGTELGLCGRLNVHVAGEVRRRISLAAPTLLVIVGQRLRELLHDHEDFVFLPAPASFGAVEARTEAIVAMVRELVGSLAVPIEMIHATEGQTAGVGLDRGARERHRVPPGQVAWLGPPAEGEAVARELLVQARIVRGFCRAGLAEAHARLSLMTHAQTSADNRIEQLERKVRTVRQETLTQEMLEVLGGRRSTRTRRALASPSYSPS